MTKKVFATFVTYFIHFLLISSKYSFNFNFGGGILLIGEFSVFIIGFVLLKGKKQKKEVNKAMGEVNKLRKKQSTKMHINYEDKVYSVHCSTVKSVYTFIAE